MKKLKIFVLFSLVFLTIFSFGCGAQEVESASITRDDARVGGSLSFVYNSDTRKISVGGEGEVVQYSSANESLGYDEGTRVGLKITAPNEVADISSGTLSINDVRYSIKDLLVKVDGQPQRFFEIYPKVSDVDDSVEFSITWKDKTKRQDYQLCIVKGTKFMQSDGSVD
jgi:hypothetical protein